MPPSRNQGLLPKSIRALGDSSVRKIGHDVSEARLTFTVRLIYDDRAEIELERFCRRDSFNYRSRTGSVGP